MPKITLSEAADLYKNRTRIREIEDADLKHSETNAMTQHPWLVYTTIYDLLKRYEDSIGTIGFPEIKASHVTVTSVNGEQVTVGLNGKASVSFMTTVEVEDDDIETAPEIKELTYTDIVNVAVKYDRIMVEIPIGFEREFQTVFMFLYSLEKNSFVGVLAKRYTENRALVITSDSLVFRGNCTNVTTEVIPKLTDMLDHFYGHDMNMESAIKAMQDRTLSLNDVYKIVARQHFIQASIKQKDFSGLEFAFDDRIMKDAHFYLFRTSHAYRFQILKGSCSAFDFYACVIEALHKTKNLSLLEIFPKHLEAFDFFSIKLDAFLKQTPIKEFNDGQNIYTPMDMTVPEETQKPDVADELLEGLDLGVNGATDQAKDGYEVPMVATSGSEVTPDPKAGHVLSVTEQEEVVNNAIGPGRPVSEDEFF